MTHPERNKYHRDAMQAVEYGDGDFYVYIHFRGDTGLPFYVGKGSKNGKYDRMTERRHKNSYWENVVNKAGYTAKVIRNCGPDEQLSKDYETELIALFRGIGFGMTNLTDGGDGTSGYIHNEETKRKLSEAKAGENNPNWGKTPSDETKRKLSEANLGKTLSEEHRQRIGESHYGKTHSEEAKQRMSESHYGKTLSEEHRQRIGEAHLGENNHQFKGFSIGYNESKIVIFCGRKDMVNRGFSQGHISQSILKNPKRKSHKGYVFIRTDSPTDVIHLLEGREFADEESRIHWEYFQANYW